MCNPAEKDFDILGSSSDEDAGKLLYKEYCTIIPTYHATFLDDNVLITGNPKEKEEKFVEHLLRDVMRDFPHLSEVTAMMIIRKTYRDMPESASSYFRRREEEEEDKAKVMYDTSGDAEFSDASDSPDTETTTLSATDLETELENERDGKENGILLEENTAVLLDKELKDSEAELSANGKEKGSETDNERAQCEDKCEASKGLGDTASELCNLQGACGIQLDSNDSASCTWKDGSCTLKKDLEDFKVHLTRTLLDSQTKPRSGAVDTTCFYVSSENNAEGKPEVGNNSSTSETCDNEEQYSSCDDCEISELQESINHPRFPSSRKRLCEHGHRFRKDTRRYQRKVTKDVIKRIMRPLPETDEELLSVDFSPKLLVEKNQRRDLIPDMNSDQRTHFIKEQHQFSEDQQNVLGSYKGASCFQLAQPERLVAPSEFLEGTYVTPEDFDLDNSQLWISEDGKSREERLDDEVHEYARPLTPLPMFINQNNLLSCHGKNNAKREDNAVGESDSSESYAVPAGFGFLDKPKFPAKLESSYSSEVFLLPHENSAKSLKRSSSEFDITSQKDKGADGEKPKKCPDQKGNKGFSECLESGDSTFKCPVEGEISSTLLSLNEQKEDDRLGDEQNSDDYEPVEGLNIEYHRQNSERAEQDKPESVQRHLGCLMMKRLEERPDVNEEQITDDRRKNSWTDGQNDSNATNCESAQTKGYVLTRKAGKTDLLGFDDGDLSEAEREVPEIWSQTSGKNDLDHIIPGSQSPNTHGTEKHKRHSFNYSETQTEETCFGRMNLFEFPENCDNSVTQVSPEPTERGNCCHQLPTNTSTVDKYGANCELNCDDQVAVKSANIESRSKNFSVPKLKELIEQHTQEIDSEDEPDVCFPERKKKAVGDGHGDFIYEPKIGDAAIEKNTEAYRAQQTTSRLKENISRTSLHLDARGRVGDHKTKKETNQITGRLPRREKSEEINGTEEGETTKPRERLRLLKILEASWPKLSETEIKTISSKAKDPLSANEEGCRGSNCKAETDSTPDNCEDRLQEKLDDQDSQVCVFSRVEEDSISISKNQSPCRTCTKPEDFAETFPPNSSGHTEPEECVTSFASVKDASNTEPEQYGRAASSLSKSDACNTDRSDLKVSAASAKGIGQDVQQLESGENEILSIKEERGGDFHSPEVGTTQHFQDLEHSFMLSHPKNDPPDSETILKGAKGTCYDEQPGRFLLEVYLKQSRLWNQSRNSGREPWDRNSQSEISASRSPLSPVSSLEEGFLSTENSIHSADTFPGEESSMNTINISNFSGDQLELIQVSSSSSNSDVSGSQKCITLAAQRLDVEEDLKKSPEFRSDSKTVGHLDVNDWIFQDPGHSRVTSSHAADAQGSTLFEKTTEGNLVLANKSDYSSEVNVGTRNNRKQGEIAACLAGGGSGTLMYDGLCQEEKCDKTVSCVTPSSDDKDSNGMSDTLSLNEFIKHCNINSREYITDEFPVSSESCAESKNPGYCLTASNAFCTKDLEMSAGDSKDCLSSTLSDGRHKSPSEIKPESSSQPVTADSDLQDVTTTLLTKKSCNNALNVGESKCSTDVTKGQMKEGNFEVKSDGTPTSDETDLSHPEISSDQSKNLELDDNDAPKTLVVENIVTGLDEQRSDNVICTTSQFEEKGDTDDITEESEVSEGDVSPVPQEDVLRENSAPEKCPTSIACGGEDFIKDHGFTPASWADDAVVSDERQVISPHDKNEEHVGNSTSERGDEWKVGSLVKEKSELCETIGNDFITGDSGTKKPEVGECALRCQTAFANGNGESQVAVLKDEEGVTDGVDSKDLQSENAMRTSANSHQTDQVPERGSLQRSADYMALLEAICMSSDTNPLTRSKSKSDDSAEERDSNSGGDLRNFSKESDATVQKVDSQIQKDVPVLENGKSDGNELPTHSKLDAYSQKEGAYSLEYHDGTTEKTTRPYNHKPQNGRKSRGNEFRQNDGSAVTYSQRDRIFSWKSYRNRRIAQKQEGSVPFDGGSGSPDERNQFRSNESTWQKRSQRANQSRRPQICNRMGTGNYETNARYKATERDNYCSDYRGKNGNGTLRSDYRSRSREFRSNSRKEDLRSCSKGEGYYTSSRAYSNAKYHKTSYRSRSRHSLADNRQVQSLEGRNSSRYSELTATTKNGNNRNGNGVEYISQDGITKNKGERISKTSAFQGDNTCENNDDEGKIKSTRKGKRRRTLSKKRRNLKSQENVVKKEEKDVEEKKKDENSSACLPKPHRCESKGYVSIRADTNHEKKRGGNSKTRSNKEGTPNAKITAKKSSKSDEVNRKNSKNNYVDGKNPQSTDYNGKVQKGTNGQQPSIATDARNRVTQEENEIQSLIHLGLQQDTEFQDGASSTKESATEGLFADESNYVGYNRSSNNRDEEAAAPPYANFESSTARVGQSWKSYSTNTNQSGKYYGQTWTNMRDNWTAFGYVNYLKMNCQPFLGGWDWRAKMGYASSRYRSCLYYPPNAHEQQNLGNMYLWKAYEEMRYQNIFSGTAQYAFHGNDPARRFGRRYDSNPQLNRQVSNGSRTSKAWNNSRYAKYSSSRSSECQNWRERRRGGDSDTMPPNSSKNSRRMNSSLKDIPCNQQATQELNMYEENDCRRVGTNEFNLQKTDLNFVGENLLEDILPSENVTTTNYEEGALEKLDQHCSLRVFENGCEESESEIISRTISDNCKTESKVTDLQDTQEVVEYLPFWEVQVSETQNVASSDKNKSVMGQSSFKVLAEIEDGKTAAGTYSTVTTKESETGQDETLKSVLEYDANLHNFSLERDENFEHSSLKQYFWKNVEQPNFEYLEQCDQSDKRYLYVPQSECTKTFAPCFSNDDYGNYIGLGEKENYTMAFVSPDSEELPSECDFYTRTLNTLSETGLSHEYAPLQTEPSYEKYSLIINIAESDSETEENSAPLSNTNSFSEFDCGAIAETFRSGQDAEVIQSEYLETQTKQQETVERTLLSPGTSNERDTEHLSDDRVKSQAGKEDGDEWKDEVRKEEMLIKVLKDHNISKTPTEEEKDGNFHNDDFDDSVEPVEDGQSCSVTDSNARGGIFSPCVKDSGKSAKDQRGQYCGDVPLYWEEGVDVAFLAQMMGGATEQAVQGETPSSSHNTMAEHKENDGTPKRTQFKGVTDEVSKEEDVTRTYEGNSKPAVNGGLAQPVYSKDGNKNSDAAGNSSNEVKITNVCDSGDASDDQSQNGEKKYEHKEKDSSVILPHNSLANIPEHYQDFCSTAERSEMKEEAGEILPVTDENPKISYRLCSVKGDETKEYKNDVNVTERENPSKRDDTTRGNSSEQNTDVDSNPFDTKALKGESSEKSVFLEKEYLFRECSGSTPTTSFTDEALCEGRIFGKDSDVPKLQSDDHFLVNVGPSRSIHDNSSSSSQNASNSTSDRQDDNPASLDYSNTSFDKSLSSEGAFNMTYYSDSSEKQDHGPDYPAGSNYPSRSFDKPLNKNNSTKTDNSDSLEKHGQGTDYPDSSEYPTGSFDSLVNRKNSTDTDYSDTPEKHKQSACYHASSDYPSRCFNKSLSNKGTSIESDHYDSPGRHDQVDDVSTVTDVAEKQDRSFDANRFFDSVYTDAGNPRMGGNAISCFRMEEDNGSLDVVQKQVVKIRERNFSEGSKNNEDVLDKGPNGSVLISKDGKNSPDTFAEKCHLVGTELSGRRKILLHETERSSTQPLETPNHDKEGQSNLSDSGTECSTNAKLQSSETCDVIIKEILPDKGKLLPEGDLNAFMANISTNPPSGLFGEISSEDEAFELPPVEETNPAEQRTA